MARYVIDIGDFTLNLLELLHWYNGAIVASVLDISSYLEPFIEGVIRCDVPHDVLVMMLVESGIPTDVASNFVGYHARRYTQQLTDILKQYKDNAPCAVYVCPASRTVSYIELELTTPRPDRTELQIERERLELEKNYENGDYVPERLRRFL